jgi:hypothetical protein
MVKLVTSTLYGNKARTIKRPMRKNDYHINAFHNTVNTAPYMIIKEMN